MNFAGHYRKISPFMAKQDTSAARRCPVHPVGAYFLNNDRHSIHYPLHIYTAVYFVVCQHNQVNVETENENNPSFVLAGQELDMFTQGLTGRVQVEEHTW